MSSQKELYRVIKEKGLKMTAQRKAVYDVIIENKGRHLNSQEIFDEVKKNFPDIGVATVYRTLTVLEDMNLVYSVDFGDGTARYELADGNEHRHHHLICTNCGSIEEVEDDLLNSIELQVKNKYDFKVENHNLKFFGICFKCREKK